MAVSEGEGGTHSSVEYLVKRRGTYFSLKGLIVLFIKIGTLVVYKGSLE